ncbi:hypothetical protein TNCV_1931151 [Trichonephila clavipes]|nr:hypothetical protein TNCV_1931151 [Trichonephila clavipes]
MRCFKRESEGVPGSDFVIRENPSETSLSDRLASKRHLSQRIKEISHGGGFESVTARWRWSLRVDPNTVWKYRDRREYCGPLGISYV